MSWILMGLWVVALLAWLWTMFCIRQGGKQRLRVIDAAYSELKRPEWEAYAKTDPYYGRHLRRLMFFRDPWVLYPPALAAAAKAGVKAWFDTEEGRAELEADIAQYLAERAARQHLQDSSVEGMVKQ